MATTEGYNGAYTGQQIDAAIGKINDAVTVPGGGTMQMGESLGGGPYTIEVTEDGEGGALTAEQVGYSNTGSGLEATNVQGAIDELAKKGGGEYLPLAGGTMKSGATIQGTDSLSIISPQQIQIATGSTAIRITGNTIVLGGDGANTSFFGTLNMGGYPIKSVPSPVDSTDAANKQYVDEHAGSRVITGTYVGTNENALNINFPFSPLSVFIFQLNYVGGIDEYFSVVAPESDSLYFFDGSRGSRLIVSWSGNRLTIYTTNGTFNRTNAKYKYIAFG